MNAPFLDPTTFYQCDRCTACCRWPGDVKISEEETGRIAQFLEMDEQAFIDQYTRLRTNRQGLSIIERDDHSCIMLENGGCRINDVKPEQCKGFPNTWNFPGWQKTCHAKPIPIATAREMGLTD